MVDIDQLAYSLGKSLRVGVDKLNAVVDENSSKMADLAGRVAAGMESGDSGGARAGVDPRATVPVTRQQAKPDYLREVERWIAAAPDSERGDGRGVAVDLAMRLPDGGNRVTRPTVGSQPDRSAVAVMAGIMAAKLHGMVAAGEEVRQFPTSPTAIALFAVQTGDDGFMEMVPLAVVHATRVPSGSATGQPVPYNPYDREWPWESGDVSKWKYMSEDLVTVLGE